MFLHLINLVDSMWSLRFLLRPLSKVSLKNAVILHLCHLIMVD